MKKILVSGSIIFLFLVSFAWADVSITLRDGTSFVVDSISFSDDQVHLPDGRILSRDDVAQILYLKGKKGWTYTPDSPDLDEYKNYLLKGKQLAKRYPGHPFYSVEDDNLFQVNPDGTHFYSSRSIYYIATEDGLRLSSQNFWITEARERMDFHALRFISKHIKISDAAPENIAIAQTNTQTRHFSRGKTVSVRIPDVQVGGLIEVFSTTDTYNPFDPKIWDARNYFQSMVPTARSVITVRAPKKMKINFYPSNLPPDKSKPIVRKVGKFKEYRWETGEMPAFLPEPNMPPYGDLVPMVIISPFFDWDVLFDFSNPL